ncbi:MAG: DUF1223 domain-containing protein [Nevskiales bacterium]
MLELFTSQGCSDCPPADALLGEFARRPGVVALAWHIDYWDHLGWRDPFASRAATERQKAYARQLGQIVFTPALVIDGAVMVVGSRRPEIEAAMANAAPLPVSVTLTRTQAGLTADIAGAEGPVRVLFAAYNPERATEVGAGENQGARLREYRIVRETRTLAEPAPGLDPGVYGAPRRFTLPATALGQGAIVLVQSADLRVLGAADQPP